MASPLDTVLNARICTIEHLANHFSRGTPIRLRGIYTSVDRLSNNAQAFWALRETKSARGRAFADRVIKVQRDARRFMTRHDADALDDFVFRQKSAACERELRETKESLRVLEMAAENSKVASQDETSPLPILAPATPFTVEILSINTPARMLVAKSPTIPLILKYHPHSQRYQLIERYCGHLECTIEENLSHYYLEPAEMLYAAWAPGMLHVHTEGYGNGGEAKDDYCNLEVRDVDELEAFMEDLIEKRVRVQQVTV
ncbi:MAG: hypothetical protein Q9185_006010 [Variospora sp. 1 TL-2023]